MPRKPSIGSREKELMARARSKYSDRVIANIFGVSHQHIHKLLGPRPDAKPVLPWPTIEAEVCKQFAAGIDRETIWANAQKQFGCFRRVKITEIIDRHFSERQKLAIRRQIKYANIEKRLKDAQQANVLILPNSLKVYDYSLYRLVLDSGGIQFWRERLGLDADPSLPRGKHGGRKSFVSGSRIPETLEELETELK